MYYRLTGSSTARGRQDWIDVGTAIGTEAVPFPISRMGTIRLSRGNWKWMKRRSINRVLIVGRLVTLRLATLNLTMKQQPRFGAVGWIATRIHHLLLPVDARSDPPFYVL
uniref:Uncharacterized protein n=1 Tax=Candidatus Kentrum sp. UNK TaxID=2126344 RepID=A0A451AV22_9GAMM|nr:MAG: hypothetical protein BECKUNK1418H_GA0071006_101839 [Candidatus Kentron sp. UNK]